MEDNLTTHTENSSINYKKTLLEKYEIPVERLDFEYIKKTSNVKELEKMVLILQSGEEGYFPDLTKCAENRLKELNPSSKILRIEDKALTKDKMTRDEWNSLNNEMKDWEGTIKVRDQKLRDVKNKENKISSHQNLPPIRQSKENFSNSGNSIKKSNRIGACDYDKWDKYDADAETLKIELNEEIALQKVEEQNKRSLEKSKMIEEIQTPVELTYVEKEIHANRHREYGNEYFKAKDFYNAIKEYTKSLSFLKTATGFNNRAMAYIKVDQSLKAIDDCDECLKLEPLNVKAMLRKGQALINHKRKREAFDVYDRILSLEPDNRVALNQSNLLKKEIEDLPPVNAFRMKIKDIDDKGNDTKPDGQKSIKTRKVIKDVDDEDPPIKEIDFSKLIIPNKIIKNKLPDVAKAFGEIKREQQKQFKNVAEKRRELMNRPVEIFRQNDPEYSGAFIEEIFD